MRLTLRTLLAYLDDILEPDDRETIGQKIAESEFAKKLVERSNDVVSRLRLAAPPVLGGSMARDPNSVAEYLDNTMAPEQIQDFEKTCLESDAHLAEVAACHHILTMILGEPVQVEPATRDRMYRLSEIAAARLAQTGGAESPATAAADGVTESETEGPTAREEREAAQDAIKRMRGADGVPQEQPMPSQKVAPTDQLPAGARSKFWPVALSAIVGAMLCLAVIVALDSSLRDRLLGRGTTASGPPAVAQGEPGDAPAAVGEAAMTAGDDAAGKTTTAPSDQSGTSVPPQDTTAGDTTAGGAGEGTANGAADSTTNGAVTPTAPAPPADDNGSGSVAPVPPALPTPPLTVPDGNVASPPLPPAPPTPAGPANITADASPAEAVGSTAGGVTPAPAPAVPAPPAAGEVGGPPGDQVAKANGALPAEATKPVPAQPAEVVGRLLSADAVLLGTRTTMEDLGRVAAQGPVSVGDRLVVLPLFRPRISLAAATVELEGPAMIEVLELLENNTPQVKVHYGRLIVRALPDAQLRLSLGGHEGLLSFADADSICAIEVRPYRSAGTDPEKVASNYAVDLYVPSGRAIWASGEEQRVIQSPTRLALSLHPDDETGMPLPAWIQSTELGPLDPRGLATIDEAVVPDRSVRLSLVELTTNRRAEIRRMAVRACAHIGHFEPLVKALGNPDDKSFWHLYIPELTGAVARGADVAAEVRKAMEDAEPEQGFQLYRMLWGYNTTGLKENGEARRLVDYLEHDLLEFRVLSFWNLQEITGAGTLSYRPEYADLKNRRAVERWRDLLDKGEIVPQRAGAEPPTAP